MAYKEEKGIWDRVDIPADRSERAARRKAMGIEFNKERLNAMIMVNRSRPDICTMFMVDEHELNDWCTTNYKGTSWDEYYKTYRAFAVGEANRIVQDMAKKGHVKALELTMRNLLGDDTEDASNRITVVMDMGDGKDEH